MAELLNWTTKTMIATIRITLQNKGKAVTRSLALCSTRLRNKM
jgi:hypothetical protein